MEADKWGRRIRAFRKLKGYTQENFAKVIGISISSLGELERGNRVPSPKVIEEICKVLQITKEELYPYDQEPSEGVK